MNTGIAELSKTFAPEALINLGPVDRIPIGEGREFEVEGELIAVFRARDGGVFGAQARCPHRVPEVLARGARSRPARPARGIWPTASSATAWWFVRCTLSSLIWRRATPWGMIAPRSKHIASRLTRKERLYCRYENACIERDISPPQAQRTLRPRGEESRCPSSPLSALAQRSLRLRL